MAQKPNYPNINNKIYFNFAMKCNENLDNIFVKFKKIRVCKFVPVLTLFVNFASSSSLVSIYSNSQDVAFTKH